jgi:16S rRNA (cytosine1402-N4)-methyltransferase
LVVVSFHSLEDRIVKRFLADRSATQPTGSRHQPEAVVPPATFVLLTHGAVATSDDEAEENPRARSAHLRAGRRTAAPPRPLDAAAMGVPNLPTLERRKG